MVIIKVSLERIILSILPVPSFGLFFYGITRKIPPVLAYPSEKIMGSYIFFFVLFIQIDAVVTFINTLRNDVFLIFKTFKFSQDMMRIKQRGVCP